jgi:uncharacterized iron-regulated membrane protein
MSPSSVRKWAWVHRWSSLVCTLFMLLLCLTGLPLIFHHEIGHLLGTEVQAPDLPAGSPRADLDKVLATAQALHPGKVPQYLSREIDDDRFWYVTLGDTAVDDKNQRFVAVDARTAQVLGQPKFDEGFMHVMFQLHVDLFAGLPGKLFLGLMGILLLVAIVSGVVLYAPFMRKLTFGTVRRGKTARVKWLDLHNLLGIVTLAWLTVVGATGVINTWADLMVKYWQYQQVSTVLAPYQGQPVPASLSSLQRAVGLAEALESDKALSFVAFPGTPFSSPHHYMAFMRGTEPLTSRLGKPVLVDAARGEVTASVELPWYLTAVLVSQPLHFGDYGGTPLQILWALLDIASIVVLGTGLYLWAKRGAPKPLVEEAEAVLDPRAPAGTAPLPEGVAAAARSAS